MTFPKIFRKIRIDRMFRKAAVIIYTLFMLKAA